MADKFSLDDIVAEYSKKDTKDNNNEEEFKSVEKEEVKPIIDDDNKLSRESIFTSHESADAKEIEPKSVAVNAVIKDDSDFSLPVDDNLDTSGRSDEHNDLENTKLEESVVDTDTIKSDKNAQVIENLMKLKKERGKVHKNTEITPVNRATIEDIDMDIEEKIIPKTEELDKAIEIPEDATYEEKTKLLSEKRKNKIDNFKLKNKQEEQKNNHDEKSNVKTNSMEFEKFSDENKIFDNIMQVKNNLTIRLCVLLFTGVFSLLITLANDFSLPLIKVFDKTMSPSSYLFTNTILGLVSIAVSYTVLSAGIKNLFKRQADCDSIAAIGILISVIGGIATLFEPAVVRENFFHVYTSVAIFGLVFNTLGKLMIVKRTEKNFSFVSGDFDRFALVNVDDENVANKFTKGSLNDFPELSTMRRTEFVEDFMKNSYSADISDNFAKKTAPFILLAGLAVGLLSLFLEKGTAGANEKIFNLLAVMSGTISMCSSFALMLVVNVPMSRAQRNFLQHSGAMLGYSSVEEFGDTNSVLVDAEQLFPNGMVDFVNLKLLGSTKIEEAILMSASLSCQAGSVLKPAFYKMLRGKTEMLYPVESYIYEDGLGLSGWIENKRVLLGTRELMENHSIEGIPTLAKEKEYTNGNVAIYLSVSGIISTLFVARVEASLSVSRWLQELEAEGITTVIRTADGFIDKNMLSKLFDVSKNSIKMLPFRFHKDYENETEYVPKISSSMLCSGHFPSFAMLIIGAKRLKFISNLGIAVQLGAAVLGGVLSLIMMLLGSFSQITPSLVICYNLAFAVLTLLIQHIKKV